VRAFDVEARIGGTWQKVASGTTIGMKRILPIKTITTDAVRVIIRSSRATPALNRFALFSTKTPK